MKIKLCFILPMKGLCQKKSAMQGVSRVGIWLLRTGYSTLSPMVKWYNILIELFRNIGTNFLAAPEIQDQKPNSCSSTTKQTSNSSHIGCHVEISIEIIFLCLILVLLKHSPWRNNHCFFFFHCFHLLPVLKPIP